VATWSVDWKMRHGDPVQSHKIIYPYFDCKTTGLSAMFATLAEFAFLADRARLWVVLQGALLLSSHHSTHHYRDWLLNFILPWERLTSGCEIISAFHYLEGQVLTGKSILACQETHPPIPCQPMDESHLRTPCNQHQ
jgi:hypothetical protein